MDWCIWLALDSLGYDSYVYPSFKHKFIEWGTKIMNSLGFTDIYERNLKIKL